MTYRAFLSTLSLRRATAVIRRAVWAYYQDFYPRSPYGERPLTDDVSTGGKIISIHALLTESDNARPETRPSCAISIHALLTESDYTHPVTLFICIIFLSTLSLRRATCSKPAEQTKTFISIHALLTESDANSHGERQGQHISIHALLTESD